MRNGRGKRRGGYEGDEVDKKRRGEEVKSKEKVWRGNEGGTIEWKGETVLLF